MKTQTLNLFKKILLGGAVLAMAACASNQSKPVAAGYYRVQPGDTLYRIAKRYGQSVSTLAAWNNLPHASKIEVGQVLRVRKNAAANPQAARTVTPVNRMQFQWPTDGGKNNVIQYYNSQQNKGLDISGSRGETVKAAAAGKVLYVGEGVRGYGKLILISHNASTITAYAHNDNILVQTDQSVRAGQPIGNMGSTDTDQVKLHFEVRINGKAVDPIAYLPK